MTIAEMIYQKVQMMPNHLAQEILDIYRISSNKVGSTIKYSDSVNQSIHNRQGKGNSTNQSPQAT